MNVEKLRRIIQYSTVHRQEIQQKVDDSYAYTGMGNDKDFLNILQIVRSTLKRKGYMILEMPFADDEIGALCYKGDALGYIVINSSLPKVNTNFAVCHEVYHVFCSVDKSESKVEMVNHYFEHEEEYAANLFAGMLLMPENTFRHMYTLFNKESEGNEQDTIIRLMSYYQVPYMAALIRCYELALIEDNRVPKELLEVDQAFLKERCRWLWLDDSILKATHKDDYLQLEAVVELLGNEYVQEGYLNARNLNLIIHNMRLLHARIKGD